MKPRLTFFTLIFLCLAPSFLAAVNVSDITGDNFEEIRGKGLEVRTNPIGVRVFIDGVDRGLTPVSFDNLPAGEHNIRLNKEGFKERQFTVVLFNNSRLVVSIEMEEERGLALVSVHRAEGSPESLPFNPRLFASSLGETDGAFQDGHTVLLNLPVGRQTIRARAFGWEDASVTARISETSAVTINIYMNPAAFKLQNGSQSRKRFNPKNSGSLGINEYRFEVSAPGTGTLIIFDKYGEAVYERQLDNFETWNQSVTWDGLNSFGNMATEGIYRIVIIAPPLAEFYSEDESARLEFELLEFETEIDYSLNIFPLSLSGGVSGLAFAPLPYVIPANSFQVEGGIFFGNFNSVEKAFSSLPFEFGIRFSPLKRLELTTVFNINPRFKNKTGWGFSGSLKFNILGGGIPLALSAVYSWASENGEAALSPGRGIGFYAPLALELKDFSLVLSPGIFWRGTDSPIPALLISSGLLYRGEWFNAGFSLRPEFDFNKNSSAFTRILAGVEARFFPPPSNLFFTVQGGFWHGNGTGGYGGVGIGVIY